MSVRRRRRLAVHRTRAQSLKWIAAVAECRILWHPLPPPPSLPVFTQPPSFRAGGTVASDGGVLQRTTTTTPALLPPLWPTAGRLRTLSVMQHCRADPSPRSAARLPAACVVMLLQARGVRLRLQGRRGETGGVCWWSRGRWFPPALRDVGWLVSCRPPLLHVRDGAS